MYYITMRLAKLDEKLVGRKLATVIKERNGSKLVNGGIEISEKVINRLKQYGMNSIYIEDENIDIELKETISEDARTKILKKLNNMYEKIIKQKFFDEYEFTDLLRKDILLEMDNEPISLPVGRITKGYNKTQHSLNVCLLSIATGRNLGFDINKIETIAKVALLHDIGKLFTSDDKGHEQIAYEFLKNKTNSVTLYSTVRFHHETIDGNGPQKLQPQYQNDLIKVISLCNYYENLLSKDNLLPNECFEKLQALVNVKFDNRIFEAFRKSVYIYPLGLPVKLSNGEEGVVIRQNKTFQIRPFVRTKNSEYNLLEHLSLFIEKIVL